MNSGHFFSNFNSSQTIVVLSPSLNGGISPVKTQDVPPVSPLMAAFVSLRAFSALLKPFLIR